PIRSTWSAAFAASGLALAIAWASLTSSFAASWSVATIAVGSLTAVARAAIGTVATITSTVARAAATAPFGPVAAGAIATTGLAIGFTIGFTIATHFVASLAGCLAFFGAQFAIAILVELLEHSRHASARTSGFALGPLTCGGIFLPLRHTGYQQHDDWRNGHPDAMHLEISSAVSAPPIAGQPIGPTPQYAPH